MLLDKENINELIKIGKQSQIGKVKNLAECIHSKIEKYKGNLRKFYEHFKEIEVQISISNLFTYVVFY